MRDRLSYVILGWIGTLANATFWIARPDSVALAFLSGAWLTASIMMSGLLHQEWMESKRKHE